MPYNAIDPFREAVERIVQRQTALGSVMPVDWSDVEVNYLQGADTNNPEGKRDPEKQFVAVTQLPDGAMGHFFYGPPDGLLVVTLQLDVWHQWRVAAEDLADVVSRFLDGSVTPGLTLATIRSGVRSTAYDPGEVKWRVSQRFAVTAYDM